MNRFDRKVLEAKGAPLRTSGLGTIQVNVGLRCNQRCSHCHVEASPLRKELMSWETIAR